MTLDKREAIISAHHGAVGLMVLIGWLAEAIAATDVRTECAARAVAEVAETLADQLKAIAGGAAA